MKKTQHQRKPERKWSTDICMSTGKEFLFVNAQANPTSTSAWSAARASSPDHGGTSAAACCKISAVSECQLRRKLICLVKVGVTAKDRAQHYEGERLKFTERKEWKEKGPNRVEEKEKKSIGRKRAYAWRVEGIYNGKEEGSFKEVGKQEDE